MGCGASTAAPDKYAEGTLPASPGGRDLKKQYTDKIKSAESLSADAKPWDTFLSYEDSAAVLADATREKLGALQYKVPTKRNDLEAQKEGVRTSRRVVVFFSPAFFNTPSCCAEFCEAVEAGVEVLPVAVEGASWGGNPFPQLTDVPESMDTSAGVIKPREAAAAVFGHTIALDHKNAYLDAFFEKLSNRLGPPAALRTAQSSSNDSGSSGDRTIRFDAFLSHKRSEAQDIVARVHDKLTDLGYRAFIDRNDLIELPSLKLAVRDTATLVVFLTPSYFASPWCCLEWVEAVAHGVSILLVHVDGAAWGKNGERSFPALEDVPETMKVEGMTLRVRDAAKKVFPTARLVEHTRSYFGPFVDALTKQLGAPPAMTSIDGEAKGAWTAAGDGATVPWSQLKASLAKVGGSNFGGAEAAIAKALGVMNPSDGATTIAAATFAKIFAETSVKATVDALTAATEDPGEKCVPVVVDGDGDGGLALVGAATSLADVRRQIIEANEEDEEEEEEDELAQKLAAGQFTFTVKSRAVKRKQEKMVKGAEMGDPINATTKEAKAKGEAPEAAAPAQAASAASAAAAAILSTGARRDADALDMESALCDPTQTLSLRRHASVLGTASGGEAGGQRADAAYLIASRLAQIKDADAVKAAALASDLIAYARGEHYGLLDGCKAVKEGDAPQAVASALEYGGRAARSLLAPALEAMRSEMFKAAAGASISTTAKGVKRVVIIGGGPCGSIVAHQLCWGPGVKTEAFHVTIIDTKEFYEDTPAVLRLMADKDSDTKGLWDMAAVQFKDILKGKGELIVGACTAIRSDHVLVGTSGGIGARAVPYDYLVISTGTSYKSDIKTEGTSIAARKAAFELERKRCENAESFTVVGGGLVGVELAFDLKSFMPDKRVEVVTRSDAWMPRVPGAHELVQQQAEEKGIVLTTKSEVVSTNEKGQAVTANGTVVGQPGARVFWATGYTPNNSYIKDSRTDKRVADCLDAEGYLKIKDTNQLQHPELSHIFAGGDICYKDAFTAGERTAAAAGGHSFAIVKNIQIMAGTREGPKLKKALAKVTPGLEVLMVSLGNAMGLIYATDPNMGMFFATAEELTKERGPLAEAGPKGWIELSPQVEFLKFTMIPDGYKNVLVKNDMALIDQFYGPDQAYKVIDVD